MLKHTCLLFMFSRLADVEAGLEALLAVLASSRKSHLALQECHTTFHITQGLMRTLVSIPDT